MILFAFILAGCSKEDETEPAEAETEEEEPEEEPDEEEEPEEEEEEEEEEEVTAEPSGGDIDFASVIAELEDITDGTTELIYENNEPYVHDEEDVVISLDGYQLLELNDFHTSFAIPFNDQTDGAIVLAHYTVENNRDELIHYTPDFSMSYVGSTRMRSHNRELIPDDVQLIQKLGPSNDYELPAGESMNGFAVYPLSLDELDDVLELETVEIEVKAAAENYDPDTYEYKPLIGSHTKFDISMSADGEDKLVERGQFYEDRVTQDNWGDKTMIKEKEDINETVELGDSTITLLGYQFTEFEPNDVEAPRFDSFENGIVLLTIKMEIENNESEDVDLGLTRSKLEVNNGAQYLLNENMLLNYGLDDYIEPGESGEWLQIYVMDQEQYEKIWQDKDFELEVGPLVSPDVDDLSKGKSDTFLLPE